MIEGFRLAVNFASTFTKTELHSGNPAAHTSQVIFPFTLAGPKNMPTCMCCSPVGVRGSGRMR